MAIEVGLFPWLITRVVFAQRLATMQAMGQNTCCCLLAHVSTPIRGYKLVSMTAWWTIETFNGLICLSVVLYWAFAMRYKYLDMESIRLSIASPFTTVWLSLFYPLYVNMYLLAVHLTIRATNDNRSRHKLSCNDNKLNLSTVQSLKYVGLLSSAAYLDVSTWHRGFCSV